MKYSLILAVLLGTASISSAQEAMGSPESEMVMEVMPVPVENMQAYEEPCDSAIVHHKTSSCKKEQVLKIDKTITVSVVGQGVVPMHTESPSQAYALAKRAAIADAYRLIAERVKGVRVDGQDLIQNMMVKRTTVRTSVQAMVHNANIVETAFKNGLCEVEMEIVLSYAQFQ